MKNTTVTVRRAILLCVVISGMAGISAAQSGKVVPLQSPGGSTSVMPMMRLISAGQWELRERGAATPPRKICVSNPVMLMQLRHGSATCSRYVIENLPNRATVHYTCPGAGHGRTTIKMETPVLIQIESQGIADNAPFNSVYEARRTGNCS